LRQIDIHCWTMRVLFFALAGIAMGQDLFLAPPTPSEGRSPLTPTPFDGRYTCTKWACVPHHAAGAQFKDLSDCKSGCDSFRCRKWSGFSCHPGQHCVEEPWGHSFREVCKGAARVGLPAVPPNNFHYGSPTAGCLANENILTFPVTGGLKGAVCSPACLQDVDCPMPPYLGAKPACAVNHQIGKGKQCVLQCSDDRDCASNAYGGSCVEIEGLKMCLFDK